MHGWFSHHFPERTVESNVVESAFLSGIEIETHCMFWALDLQFT